MNYAGVTFKRFDSTRPEIQLLLAVHCNVVVLKVVKLRVLKRRSVVYQSLLYMYVIQTAEWTRFNGAEMRRVVSS